MDAESEDADSEDTGIGVVLGVYEKPEARDVSTETEIEAGYVVYGEALLIVRLIFISCGV